MPPPPREVGAPRGPAPWKRGPNLESSSPPGLSRLIGRCSQYRALLLAFFKGLSQGSEFLFCGLGRPLLLMSVSAERARRLLRLTGGAAGLLCPSSRIRLPWPRWPACPSAIRLGRSGSHHLRFAHGRGPRRRRPITEELGRDRALGQDRETRPPLLAGQAPSHEIRPELPLGHRRQVEGPHHRAGRRRRANFAGLGPLALLREPRREGIARADELPWRDIAEGIAGMFGRFGHARENELG